MLEIHAFSLCMCVCAACESASLCVLLPEPMVMMANTQTDSQKEGAAISESK